MSRKTYDRRAVLKATGGAATFGLLAGCLGGGDGNGNDGDNGGNTTGGGGGGSNTINIGSVQPLSGGFASWGQAHSAGLSFAVNEINANGGVLDGQNLNIVEANSESDPAEASSIFDRFAEERHRGRHGAGELRRRNSNFTNRAGTWHSDGDAHGWFRRNDHRRDAPLISSRSATRGNDHAGASRIR